MKRFIFPNELKLEIFKFFDYHSYLKNQKLVIVTHDLSICIIQQIRLKIGLHVCFTPFKNMLKW